MDAQDTEGRRLRLRQQGEPPLRTTTIGRRVDSEIYVEIFCILQLFLLSAVEMAIKRT